MTRIIKYKSTNKACQVRKMESAWILVGISEQINQHELLTLDLSLVRKIHLCLNHCFFVCLFLSANSTLRTQLLLLKTFTEAYKNLGFQILKKIRRRRTRILGPGFQATPNTNNSLELRGLAFQWDSLAFTGTWALSVHCLFYSFSYLS